MTRGGRSECTDILTRAVNAYGVDGSTEVLYPILAVLKSKDANAVLGGIQINKC